MTIALASARNSFREVVETSGKHLTCLLDGLSVHHGLGKFLEMWAVVQCGIIASISTSVICVWRPPAGTRRSRWAARSCSAAPGRSAPGRPCAPRPPPPPVPQRSLQTVQRPLQTAITSLLVSLVYRLQIYGYWFAPLSGATRSGCECKLLYQVMSVRRGSTVLLLSTA